MEQSDTFLNKVSGVVHVGANSGQERNVYRDLGLRTVWVEAIPEVYDRLVANLQGYPDQKAIKALLTDTDGTDHELHVANNEGASSSIFELGDCLDIWPQIAYTGSLILKSMRLDTLMARENVSPSQYQALVMDVQGAELLVMKGAGKLLGQFRFVKAEAADFESYKGCARLDDLDAYLAPLGFVEVSRDEFATRPDGGSYFDVVWERPARNIVERLKWALFK